MKNKKPKALKKRKQVNKISIEALGQRWYNDKVKTLLLYQLKLDVVYMPPSI